MNTFTEMFSPRVLIQLAFVRPFVKLFFGINAVGREHLSDVGQCIVIANHNSHLDVLLLFSILPVKLLLTTHPVAAQEYFARWKVLFRIVDYVFKPIWIVRGDKAEDPLEGMKRRLDAGHSVIIFPEGTRGKPGEIARFKSGIGMLAVEYPKIPIVPVYLLGPERAFPRASSFPLPLWNEITVGPPQVFSGTRRDITAALENTVRELSESAAANRHRRRRRPLPPFTVAVLGIDGSGKSTLARALAQRLAATASACLVTDGLEFYEQGCRKELQPLLREKVRQAVGKYAKTAKSLQHYKAPKLAELLLRDHIMSEVVRWYAPKFVALDGCPLLNLAAWASLYKEDRFNAQACAAALRLLSGRGDAVSRTDPIFAQFPELAALKRLRLAHLGLPGLVLMLDVEPSVAVGRIERRGEHRQVHETEEKLTRLRTGYRLVCEVVQENLGIPTRILDGARAIDDLEAEAMVFIEQRLPERTCHE